jgi:hypothetical protein
MRSFFVKDRNSNFSNKTACSKPIEYSRSFEKGKSFNCSEYEQGRTYYNNDFLQDFVIYKGCLYVCIKETTDIPNDSEN